MQITPPAILPALTPPFCGGDEDRCTLILRSRSSQQQPADRGETAACCGISMHPAKMLASSAAASGRSHQNANIGMQNQMFWLSALQSSAAKPGLYPPENMGEAAGALAASPANNGSTDAEPLPSRARQHGRDAEGFWLPI